MKQNGLRTLILLFAVVLAMHTIATAKELPAELQEDAVKIINIIEDTSFYEGKNVLIEGTIETECPAGCWFIVNDEGASLFIDIFPSNFVIPQEAGSRVKVYGEITTKDNDPMMIGKMVEINGEVFK
jgi:hypothetical protein